MFQKPPATEHKKNTYFCFVKKLKVLKWAEFLLQTNYPSETDKSFRYKSGVHTNFGPNSAALDSDVLMD